MHFVTWPTVRSLFKVSCFAALVSMTSYWFYKFVIEDEDLCLVDYIAVERANELSLPMVSMCFRNPFVDKKLKAISPDVNSTNYLQYLQGDIFDDKFNEIDYNTVTFNLSEYYYSEVVYWRNGSSSYFKDEADVVKKPYVIFSGFWYGGFLKCFGFELNDKYKKEIRYIIKSYKQNEFLDGFNREEKYLCVLFHYPGQFLLTFENFKRFRENRAKRSSYWLDLNIKGVEILKRRDKRGDRCMNDGESYDNLLLEEHVKKYGCKAPYQKTIETFPVCSSQNEIKQSLYEGANVKSNYYHVPCKGISKIDVDHSENDHNITGENGELLFSFLVGFPRQLKLITQSKAVDINSFIGNIGGYIGLFLGYALIQLPDLVLFVYGYLKKVIGKHSASTSDSSTVPEQSIINVTSVFPPSFSSISAIHFKEGTGKNSLKFATRQELYKVQELMRTMVEKLDDISQRMGNAEEKLRHSHK